MTTDSPTYLVQYHFEGKEPSVRETYDRLLSVLREIGNIVEEPKKTSIHLVRNSALVGVETRKSYLLLNIKTSYAIQSPRVQRVEQVSSNRFHNKMKLVAAADIDNELKRWLTDAYGISG